MANASEIEPSVTAGQVLVVDDEFSVRDSLEGWFRKDGLVVTTAADAMEALRKLQERPVDVVLLDIRMPGIDGMELLRRLHELDPALVVIMITAFASVDTAVEALKQGAFDYVTKPIDPDELSRLVARGLEHRRAAVGSAAAGAGEPPEIVAESAAMRRALAAARAAAATDAPVMFRGEPGSGRERLAHFVHASGSRRNFPFVPVACGAFAEEQLEGELFGHEQHAFEGARFRRRGRLEMADGGTVMLEDVDALPLRLQVEVLRALDAKRSRRLGGTTPVPADVRVIATTHADLEQLVREGRFREDLFFRLSVVAIDVPPLRERREDLPELARRVLAEAARRLGRPFEGFDRAALDALCRAPWPGNLPELARTIEHAVVVGKPPTVRARDLELHRAP